MQFWVQPPNKQTTHYIFRTLFALGLLSSISSLISDLQHHPLTEQTLWPALLTAAIMCGIAATMTTISVYFAKRRERRLALH